METPSELDSARNLVFQKVGRNLANFQRMEAHLKMLLKSVSFTVRGVNFEEFQESLKAVEKRRERISKMTLKSLVDSVADTLFVTELVDAPSQYKMFDYVMTSDIRIKIDRCAVDEWKRVWKEIVKERNRLAHHLLCGTELDSVDGCRALSDALDRQRALYVPQFRTLNKLLEDVHGLLQQHVATLNQELHIADKA